MKVDVISSQDNLLIRRLVLDPGEAMYWHHDACRRFTVVVRGTTLAIEYQDSGERVEFPVHPGLADWDEPEQRVHRAINTGSGVYEEVVTFYREGPEVDPQPRH